VASKPRRGSRAWEEALADSPTYAKNAILWLARRAERGDREAVENLFRWLERYPDMRSLVRSLDDLATKVERCWVERMCGTNLLSQRAVEDEVTAMKAELLGPAPSVTDKVLAATVLVAHLAFHRAAREASQPADQPAVREARERLLSAAQKRLQDAFQGWERIAARKAKGVRPRAKLRLFDPDAVA
jgi:hypothetical protein